MAVAVAVGGHAFQDVSRVMGENAGMLMAGGRWYQSEYVLSGPAGSYMTIFAFFVPS